MKSRCFRGHFTGCSKNKILKSRILFCSHECLLAAAQLICWVWEGMFLLYCPHPQDENVFISKKMCHMQAILVVSVSKKSANYFFCYLAFGVIKTSLSKSWDKGFFTWEPLSYHIQKSILSWIVCLSHHIYKSWDIISLLGFVSVVVFGTPVAPTASCRVVAAPRSCEASRAEC